MPIKRRAFHRAVFTAAAAYNLLWGLYALIDPQWLFRFAGMPLLNHPAIFAGLGVVVGAFSVVYLEVARHPERGFWLAAAGMAGKVLGLTSLGLIARGEWPPAAAVLTLTNDVIWLAPFALYLHDAWPSGHRPPKAGPAPAPHGGVDKP